MRRILSVVGTTRSTYTIQYGRIDFFLWIPKIDSRNQNAGYYRLGNDGRGSIQEEMDRKGRSGVEWTCTENQGMDAVGGWKIAREQYRRS